MTAKEIRLRAKQRLNGNFGKAFLIIFLYSLIISLANSIPILGGMAMVVISPVLVFGIYKSIVLLVNGEKVGLFDYFKLGFDNFAKVWQLIWEVLKKTWVPLLVMLLGCAMVFGSILFGSFGVLFTVGMDAGAEISTALGIVTFLIFGVSCLLIIGGAIWYIIKSLRYTLVNFYLMKSSNLTAKEIMELNEKNIKNNVGKVARIMFFYFGISFLISLLVYILAFAIIFLISLLFTGLSLPEAVTNIITKLISSIIIGIGSALTNGFIMPKLIASYNELHEYISSPDNTIVFSNGNI